MSSKKYLIKKKKIIFNKDGDILKFISNRKAYKKEIFGEIYFSKLKKNKIKAWKYHSKQTQNLIVPIGSIKIVIIDYSEKYKKILQRKIISLDEKKNYNLVTIKPKVWYGFKNIGLKEALLVNFTDIAHDKNEGLKMNINNNKFKFNWKKI